MNQPKKTLGKYSLIRHLATGGMAEIWLGEQVGPGGFSKQLVIKRILSHLAQDQQFASMFLDEARTVAMLTHPNIGQVYELGQVDESYFIAMEFIDGIDLADMSRLALEQGREIPLGIAVKIVVDMLQGLEYAHNFHDRDGHYMGLVHRDVTPHNVLVSNDGVVKLVDFGVAKAKANQSKTQTGAVKGKFAYMAPEQIESRNMDRRVDVFAAGVVLYELLTLEKPFGDDLFAVNAILTRPTPDPREVRADIPQSIVNIISLALSKEADARYQTARTMMSDLEEYMSASGMFVHQRDIATYVRSLQGMGAPQTGRVDVSAGPRALITERAEALVVPQNAEVIQPTAAVASLASAASSSGQHVPTQVIQPGQAETFEYPDTPRKSNTALVVFAVMIILGVLGAGAFTAVVLLKKTPAEERAVAARLMHKKGEPVKVTASAPAKLYYQRKLVADLPFETTLKPGTYTVEARNDSSAKIFKLKVMIPAKKNSATQVFHVTM